MYNCGNLKQKEIMLTQEQRAKFNPVFLKRVEDFAAQQTVFTSPREAHGLNLIAQLILGQRLIALEDVRTYWADLLSRKSKLPLRKTIEIAHGDLINGEIPIGGIYAQIEAMGFKHFEIQNRIEEHKINKFFFIAPPENEDLAAYLASGFKLPFCSPGIDYFVGLAFGYGMDAVKDFILGSKDHYKRAEETENV